MNLLLLILLGKKCRHLFGFNINDKLYKMNSIYIVLLLPYMIDHTISHPTLPTQHPSTRSTTHFILSSKQVCVFNMTKFRIDNHFAILKQWPIQNVQPTSHILAYIGATYILRIVYNLHTYILTSTFTMSIVLHSMLNYLIWMSEVFIQHRPIVRSSKLMDD